MIELSKEVKNFILNKSFDFVFSNRKENNWPEDPIGLLKSRSLVSGKLSLKNNKELVPREEYKSFPVLALLGMLVMIKEDIEDSVIFALEQQEKLRETPRFFNTFDIMDLSKDTGASINLSIEALSRTNGNLEAASQYIKSVYKNITMGCKNE